MLSVHGFFMYFVYKYRTDAICKFLSVGCFFILLMVSFAVYKLFNFM